MKSLGDWYRQRRRQQAIAFIRAEMEAMGHDTSALSDEELEAEWQEGCERFRQGMISVSVSAAEAVIALERLANTMGRFETALVAASWPDVVLEDILDAEIVGE